MIDGTEKMRAAVQTAKKGPRPTRLLFAFTVAVLADISCASPWASTPQSCLANKAACSETCTQERSQSMIGPACATLAVQYVREHPDTLGQESDSSPKWGEHSLSYLQGATDAACAHEVPHGCEAMQIVRLAAAPKPASPPASSAPVAAVASLPSPPPPAPIGGEVIIYDGGSSAAGPRVTTLVGANKLASQESDRVLGLVFGSARLADPSQCRGVGDGLRASCLRGGVKCPSQEQVLDAVRVAGDIVPSVLELARGSFTTARSNQSLYLIANGECGASHADNFGSMTLAVTEGNTVVAKAIVPGGSSIHGVVDVDGDGRDEVVLTSGFTGQGTTLESARLVRLDGSALTTVKDFKQVSGNNCGGMFGPKADSHSIIHATVGSPPKFRVEKKSGPCQ